MPATIITKEEFEKSTPKIELEKEIELRILAGAIRSKIIDKDSRWIIETEWNVFGQQ